MSPTPLTIYAHTFAHFLDQPGLINQIHGGVKGVGIPAMVAGKVLYDVAHAPPGKEADVFVQDASILVPSVAATYWGLSTISESAEAMTRVSDKLKKEIPALQEQSFVEALNTHRKAPCAHGHAHHHVKETPLIKYHSFPEMRKLVEKVFKTSPKGKQAEHLAKLFYRTTHDHNLSKILLVGGGIVLAGMAGGLAHDALTQNPDDKARRNKVKEAIFQFVANIAMCVTGGTLGEKFAEWRKWTPSPTDFSDQARKLRWKRTTAMGVGLAAGITAGGWVANWLGKTVVNPFFDWVDNRQDGYSLISAYKEKRNGDTRKIEPLDLALHLDDIPTMVAIAGVSALLPLVPMFYLVSAWRAGVGYRSCHETATKSCSATKNTASLPAAKFRPLPPAQTFAYPTPWGATSNTQYL